MIDKKWIGHELPRVGAADRAQPAAVLRQGDRRDRPGLHRRRRGARRRLPRPAGAADLPVRGRARLRRRVPARRADLQIPIAKLLHGEQSFSYHRPACVGDTVTVRSTHQRHLRQEERRARVRRQDLARHQPARRARRRAALGARLPPLKRGLDMKTIDLRRGAGRRRAAAAATAAGRPHDAGALRRRLGRPQPDPRRHRRRPPRRHARRVRPGHAGHGLARPAASPAGRRRAGCAGSTPASRASPISATRCAAAAAWSRSSRHHGEHCVRIELQSANQFGQTKIVGEALVALP